MLLEYCQKFKVQSSSNECEVDYGLYQCQYCIAGRGCKPGFGKNKKMAKIEAARTAFMCLVQEIYEQSGE